MENFQKNWQLGSEVGTDNTQISVLDEWVCAWVWLAFHCCNCWYVSQRCVQDAEIVWCSSVAAWNAPATLETASTRLQKRGGPNAISNAIVGRVTIPSCDLVSGKCFLAGVWQRLCYQLHRLCKLLPGAAGACAELPHNHVTPTRPNIAPRCPRRMEPRERQR